MEYKQASLTADVILFRGQKSKCSDSSDSLAERPVIEVLLIRRAETPDNVYGGCWALVGGFVDLDKNEVVRDAAHRELKEETGIDLSALFPNQERLEFIGFFDEPERDPRGRTISFVHVAGFTSDEAALLNASGQDDASDAKWFNIYELPENLAFDHKTILDKAVSYIGAKLFSPQRLGEPRLRDVD